MLDWRLGRVIPLASLVVCELVSSSTINADIDLSVVWDRGALRLTVRDHGPALPDQRPAALGLHRRGLTVVAGLSRAFGVLPTADGGKFAWAVLEAPRSRPRQAESGQGVPPHPRSRPYSPTAVASRSCRSARVPAAHQPQPQLYPTGTWWRKRPAL
jgi:hypothetical protein